MESKERRWGIGRETTCELMHGALKIENARIVKFEHLPKFDTYRLFFEAIDETKPMVVLGDVVHTGESLKALETE